MPAKAHSSLRPRNGSGPIDSGGPERLVRLEVLGGFALRVDGAAARQPPHVQRLLAFLALHRHPLHRAFVSGRLWPQVTQEHAFGCLRTTLWRIGDRSGLLETTSTNLALAPAVEVDAAEVEAAAEAILIRGRIIDAAAVHPLLHAEPLLPDWYDDWALEARERLAELRLLALEVAADVFIAAGAYSEAALVANAAVRADPFRESAARLLIRLHLATGNPGQAIREYRSFRERLARDFALEPSPETIELVRSLA